jgi:hypothetical protein
MDKSDTYVDEEDYGEAIHVCWYAGRGRIQSGG